MSRGVYIHEEECIGCGSCEKICSEVFKLRWISYVCTQIVLNMGKRRIFFSGILQKKICLKKTERL